MIATSLRQIVDTSALTPSAASAPGPKGGDFASLLSGASLGDGATVIGGMPDPAGPAVNQQEDAGTASTCGSSADPATSSSRPASRITDASDPDVAAKTMEVALPTTSPTTVTPPAPKVSKQTSGKSDDHTDTANPDSISLAQPDPASLTIQQALLAAASFASPAPSGNQPGKALSGLTNAESGTTLPPPAATASRVSGAVSAKDLQQLLDPKEDAVGPLQQQAAPSHGLGLTLEQHVFHAVEPAPADHQSASLSSVSRSEIASQSQGPDLHQLDALVRDIAEVSGSSGRAALKLTADQLGVLDIKLHRSDAGINVSIRTDNEQGHSSVAQAQHQLADDLRSNGLKVAATSVLLGGGGTDRDRSGRTPLPFAAPIEASASAAAPTETTNKDRPDGRYA